MRRTSLALALVLVVACDHATARRRHDGAARSSPDAAPIIATTDEPLFGGLAENPIDLPVPGFLDAVVDVPVGATTPQPIIVAAHGSYDRPDWQCREWRQILGERAIIVCPTGVPVPGTSRLLAPRFAYDGGRALRTEVDAAVSALRARFGRAVAEGPIVFGGFSLGAMLGPEFCTEAHTRCSAIVAIEGSQREWTDDVIRRFALRGGRRVLFACGRVGCVAESMPLRPRFARFHVDVQVTFGASGHNYVGQVARAVHDAFDWVVQGDARFDGSTTSSSALSR